ncbi:Aminopeptidase M1 [Glycine soja]
MQSQFLLSGQHGKWVVPITLSIGSYERQKKFLLETSQGRMLSPSQNCLVCLARHSAKCTCPAGSSDHALSAGCALADDNCVFQCILDDGNALCQACEQSLSSLLMLKDVYRKEIDYVIVSKLIDVCYDVLKITTDAIPDSVNELKQYFISLLMCSAEQLGWDSISGEDHSISLLRGEVFQALATFDHAKTQQDALCRFQILLDGRNTSLLPANIRRVAYIAVMRNTTTENRTGLESLLSFYRSCIASSADPNVVIEVLNLLLSDADNWERILARYGAGLLLTNFISQMFPLVNSDEKADEIEEFFASHMNHSIIMNLKLSIEQI